MRPLFHFFTRIDPRWIALFLAACFFAASTFDIATYPLAGADEPTLSDPALQLVNTGHLRSDVLSENPGWDTNFLLHPPGLTFATAATYRAFGFGIWQTRLPSILFGALGVALVFILVRDITQRMMPALLAAAALICWPAWVLTAKVARMDTGAIFFLLLASILVHKSIRSATGYRPRLLFAAGLCVSAASTFHTASFTWALALLVTVLYFSTRRLWAAAIYCTGACMLIGAWLVYASFHLEAFKQQFLYIVLYRTSDGGILFRFVEEGARYLDEFTRVATIAMLAAVAVVGIATSRPWKNPSMQFLFVLTGVLAFANALIAGKASGYYTLYPMTLALCILAIGIAECMELTGAGAYRYVPTFAVLTFVLFLANLFTVSYGPRLLAAVFQRAERNYAVQFAPLSAILKPHDQVWGSGVAWYAIVSAGARLDLQPHSIPLNWDTHPDPLRHRYVVVAPGGETAQFTGFVKIEDFGSPLPRVVGSQLSNSSYVFEIWKSRRIP